VDKTHFMRACREGGEAVANALRALDRTYFAVLHREGVRVLRDADAARDLVQDTFLKVWQRCATFRGDSELLPWIKSILRNAAIERLRQPLREVPLDEGDDMSAEVQQRIAELSCEQTATPETQALRRQLVERFDSGWGRFRENDPVHANVLAWLVEDGLSIDEIARLLGRTPGATREFLSQCRKRARVHLAEWYALASGNGAGS